MGRWRPLAEGLGLSAMGIVDCPSALCKPEFGGKGGQRDARMNVLAVKNTSVNGAEITPDDAERVSWVLSTVSNMFSDINAVQASMAKGAIWSTNGLRASAEVPCNS